MMQYPSKFLIGGLIAVVVTTVGGLGLPTSVGAQQPASRTNFCASLDTVESTIDRFIGRGWDKLDQHRGQRTGKIAASRSVRDRKLTAWRGDFNGRRADVYARLIAKADTDVKRAAVTAFQSTIEQAVSERKTDVDAAIAAYRNGIDALIAEHSDAIDGAIDELKTAVATAHERAAADCEAGVDEETVKENYRDALRDAYEAFRADRSAADQLRAEQRTLAAEWKAAITDAVNTFMTTLQQAKAELKAAFQSEE